MSQSNNQNNQITAFAPATVANVACGFDIMGFAIDEPGDIVRVRKSNQPGVKITKITGDGGNLPKQAGQNTASVAVMEFLSAQNISEGVEIDLEKQTPMGSGLGSSAASPAAAVLAVNTLFGNPLTREELLPFAVTGESVASKAIHADNVAPALLGGFILIRSYDPIDIIKISTPSDLYCAVVLPKVEIRTAEARELLPKKILLKTAIKQWGNVGGLIAGLEKSDYGLISRSLQDVVAEPVRSNLIPGFKQMKQAALNAGALGCSISGSGPAVFALCKGETIANSAGKAMQTVLYNLAVGNSLYISKINQDGAKIV